MKKFLKIIIVLLIIIAAILGAYAYINYRNEINPSDITNPSGDTQNNGNGLASNVIIKDVVIENRTDNRYVDCVYPTISSFSDKEFESAINKEIAQNIQAYINEMGYFVDEETPATAIYSYIATYQKYTSGNYLSLVISEDYQTGGIRSNKWKDIYNVNVKTEKIFYLNELFEDDVDYEKAIIAEITRQASEKEYELMGGNGLTKLPAKQKFYVKDDKLVIYFDPSEAAANVYGELHFEMPFVMNESGYFEI